VSTEKTSSSGKFFRIMRIEITLSFGRESFCSGTAMRKPFVYAGINNLLNNIFI